MRFVGILLLGSIAVTPLGSGAWAQTSPAQTEKAAPQKGPVPIPRTQFIADMDSDFGKMDADKNGILTKKEIEDHQRAVIAALIEDRRRTLFASLDADHNGALTPAEFAKLQLPSPRVNAAPLLVQTDLNRDGQITLVEFRTGKLRNFDSMDTDKDGIVSVAEMRAAGLIH